MTTIPEGGYFDWRSTESCRQLLTLPRDGWAWEFLRCNPRFQAAVTAWAGRNPPASAPAPAPAPGGKIIHLRAVDVPDASAWDVLPFRLSRAQRQRWHRLLAAFGLFRRAPLRRRSGRRWSRRRFLRHR